jgi:uncharacterized protein
MKRTMLLAAATAALWAGVLPAQHAGPPPSIRVAATGEVRAAPDQAMVDFAVETLAPSAQQAAAENARRMEAVIAALVRAGVPRARIETRDYSVFPDYEHRDGAEPRIRGYRVSNTVQATLHEVGRVGATIDAALAAGANRVHGVRFGVRNPEALRQQAIADALRRARADADAMAAALGVRLGPVQDAATAEAPTYGPGPMPMMRLEMADAATTPVAPAEQVIRASVSVVYLILPGG